MSKGRMKDSTRLTLAGGRRHLGRGEGGREGRGCRAAGDAGERSRGGGGSCGAPGERGWKCFHNPQPE